MIEKLITENLGQLADVIRTLAYRENKEIISKIDFNDQNIFLDPLLFAYFNREQTDTEFSLSLLTELMQSHFIEKEPLTIDGAYNKEGIAYIPNLGYYKQEEGQMTREDFLYLEDTDIEVLKCEIPLLRNVLEVITSRTPGDKVFHVKKEYVEENLETLNKAFKQIRMAIPTQFEYIEKCLKKILLFKDPNPLVASRVTINSLGTLFINIHENDKNLPFFIDTIAYQTGSLIMTIMLQDKDGIFKVDCRQRIADVINQEDRRNFYTLFHRMYCHYSSFLCLHHYLEKNLGATEDEEELTQRMVFYLRKCEEALEKFNLFATNSSGREHILTEAGIYLIELIENSLNKVSSLRKSDMERFADIPVSYRSRYSEFVATKA